MQQLGEKRIREFYIKSIAPCMGHRLICMGDYCEDLPAHISTSGSVNWMIGGLDADRFDAWCDENASEYGSESSEELKKPSDSDIDGVVVGNEPGSVVLENSIPPAASPDSITKGTRTKIKNLCHFAASEMSYAGLPDVKKRLVIILYQQFRPLERFPYTFSSDA